VLEQVGKLLARLHEACCYLDDRGIAQLSVCREGVALEGVEGVMALRRPSPRRACGDLARLRRWLGRAEWESVERGYGALAESAWVLRLAAVRRTASEPRMSRHECRAVSREHPAAAGGL
jgi:hypothetical protein